MKESTQISRLVDPIRGTKKASEMLYFLCQKGYHGPITLANGSKECARCGAR